MAKTKWLIFILIGTLFFISGCTRKKTNTISPVKNKGENIMKIRVINNDLTVDYQLNDSSAAQDLFKQLPIKTEIKNYSDDEKIFYPKKLNTKSTPKANAKDGDLAYFAPWGDVVLYYKDFGSYSGLYALGKVIKGKENISKLSGQVTINRLD